MCHCVKRDMIAPIQFINHSLQTDDPPALSSRAARLLLQLHVAPAIYTGYSRPRPFRFFGSSIIFSW